MKDEAVLTDSLGYMTIVLGDRNEMIENICDEQGFHFMHWNMTWPKALILFGHMLAAPSFEAQIDHVPAIPAGLSDFTELEVYKNMGEYTPYGFRMPKNAFIAINRDLQ